MVDNSVKLWPYSRAAPTPPRRNYTPCHAHIRRRRQGSCQTGVASTGAEPDPNEQYLCLLTQSKNWPTPKRQATHIKTAYVGRYVKAQLMRLLLFKNTNSDQLSVNGKARQHNWLCSPDGQSTSLLCIHKKHDFTSTFNFHVAWNWETFDKLKCFLFGKMSTWHSTSEGPFCLIFSRACKNYLWQSTCASQSSNNNHFSAITHFVLEHCTGTLFLGH